MTIRQQIRDRIIELLNTDRPSNIPEATKRRFIPDVLETRPRIAVFFLRENTSRPGGRSGPLTQRNLFFAVVPIVAVEDPGDVDDALEPLLEWIVNVLGKTNLDGLATDLEEGGGSEAATQWIVRNHDLLYAAAPMVWRVEYQTLRNDLSAQQ